MLLVIGGVGFIGLNVVVVFNDVGCSDVVVCDVFGDDGKWCNFVKCQFVDIVLLVELMDWLKGCKLEGVVYFGVILVIMVIDGDFVIEINFWFLMCFLDWCMVYVVLFIYVFLVVIYGDGEGGFDDDVLFLVLKKLCLMNFYGWSKYLFDFVVVGCVVNGNLFLL